jgi:cell division cycle 14
MRKAVSLGHFDYASFVPADFHQLAKLQHGDFSWIIPHKFVAFSGPLNKRREVAPGVHSLLPNEYIPIMKRLGVTCIVRFNSKCYDRAVFTAAGIRHVDLYYEDGGNPSEAILQVNADLPGIIPNIIHPFFIFRQILVPF